ncbi:MAG: hypothetical protein L6R42_007342, partial [Xanthoria sp. 1 TBL-2021]
MVAILAASGEDGEASVQEQSPADDDSGNSLDVVKFILQRALDDRKRWNPIKRRELERQELEEEKDLPQVKDDDQNHGETDNSSQEVSTDDDQDDCERMNRLQGKPYINAENRLRKDMVEAVCR